MEKKRNNKQKQKKVFFFATFFTNVAQCCFDPSRQVCPVFPSFYPPHSSAPLVSFLLCCSYHRTIPVLPYASQFRRFSSAAATAQSTLKQQLNEPTPSNCRLALSEEEIQQYERDGFLHIKQFIPKEVAKLVRDQAMSLLQNFDADETGSVFAAHAYGGSNKDNYFLESGDKVRFFWEADAFDLSKHSETSEDEAWARIRRNQELYINKIGHALHTLDPVMHGYVFGFGIGRMLYQLGYTDPVALQSMYICKQAGVGGEVPPHQDSPFLWTEPWSCMAFWLSVDASDTENGCLWAVPGSHRDSSVGVRSRFMRKRNPDSGELEESTELVPLIGDGSFGTSGGQCIETEEGDLVLLHGSLVHWSDANRSERVRHALMLHCIDGQCEYPAENWLQYPGGPDTFPRFTPESIHPETMIAKRMQMFRDH